MRKIIVPAYSKINVTLTLGEKDEERGLHPIDTVMHTIELHDVVTLTKRRDAECTCNLSWPDDVEDNALRAARLFTETFCTAGVDIVVEKNIPVGAGLGGSAADAAATLRGMAVLYEIDSDRLLPLAEQLGSDVPYLLYRGAARVTGFGEKVELLPAFPLLYALVVVPTERVNTAEAFAAYDAMGKKPSPVYTDEVMNLLYAERNTKLYQNNNFYPVSSTRCPAIGGATKALQDLRSLHIAMTGSGSAVYALYNRPDYAAEKRDTLLEAGYDCRLYRLID